MSLDERAIWEELWTGYLDFYDTKISQETNCYYLGAPARSE